MYVDSPLESCQYVHDVSVNDGLVLKSKTLSTYASQKGDRFSTVLLRKCREHNNNKDCLREKCKHHTEKLEEMRKVWNFENNKNAAMQVAKQYRLLGKFGDEKEYLYKAAKSGNISAMCK